MKFNPTDQERARQLMRRVSRYLIEDTELIDRTELTFHIQESIKRLERAIAILDE